MSDINKCREKFLVHLSLLYLGMRGRKNFLMMERYGGYGEQTYWQHFSKPHDFRQRAPRTEGLSKQAGRSARFPFQHRLDHPHVAKAHHWLSIPKEQRQPFSMADIKTQYINEPVLDRLICIYGKCPSVEKNNPKIQKLYQWDVLLLNSLTNHC